MALAMTSRSPHSPPADADWSAISRRLLRVARALTGRADDAEDLTQQAIASVLARRPDMARHEGYIRTTLIRAWLDRERSMRRRLARAAAWARLRPAWHTDAPTEEHGERLGQIRDEIERLPTRQRLALTLRLIEGLTYEQIAEAMVCDVGTVRANLHLARARLRATLGEDA
ncbi:MAG: RNA polymerase sigma factor [Phycisphaerales bacterium]|nr:RNA polymerase sigma factor [Phycisphaerales bacterium]